MDGEEYGQYVRELESRPPAEHVSRRARVPPRACHAASAARAACAEPVNEKNAGKSSRIDAAVEKWQRAFAASGVVGSCRTVVFRSLASAASSSFSRPPAPEMKIRAPVPRGWLLLGSYNPAADASCCWCPYGWASTNRRSSQQLRPTSRIHTHCIRFPRAQMMAAKGSPRTQRTLVCIIVMRLRTDADDMRLFTDHER